MSIRNDINNGENLTDPRADYGLLLTSVFGLLAIRIENWCNLQIGGYS